MTSSGASFAKIDRKEPPSSEKFSYSYARIYPRVFRPQNHECTLNYPLFIIALSRFPPPSRPSAPGRKLFSPLIYRLRRFRKRGWFYFFFLLSRQKTIRLAARDSYIKSPTRRLQRPFGFRGFRNFATNRTPAIRFALILRFLFQESNVKRTDPIPSIKCVRLIWHN